MKDESRYYVAPTVKPGDDISYGDWRDTPGPHTWYHDDYIVRPHNPLGSYRATGILLTVIDLATGGDYSGCLVQASNARCLKADFPWLVTLHGGHGTFGVAYLGKRENQNPRLLEALDGLATYPLYNEDDHSELECDKESEAWESDGRKDFARALAKHFDATDEDHEHDLDDTDHALIDALWWDCTERFMGGESFRNESGDSIYFPIDDVIEKIGRNWPGINDPHYSGDRPPIAVQLATLATSSRVKES